MNDYDKDPMTTAIIICIWTLVLLVSGMLWLAL